MREQNGTSAAALNGRSGPREESVRAQLDKILASSGFVTAERLSRFLRFIVEQALEGSPVKETVVGMEVFGRKPGYDPRLDGVVRVEAVKLRSRLKEYYESEGAGDPIRIDLPRGGYLPTFEGPSGDPPAPPPRPAQTGWWRDWRVVIPPLALVALIAGYLLAKGPHRPPHDPGSPSSIAVLPFVNLSSDKENEYFSDGLTDDLIDALTKVQGLRVVARSSAFQFKGQSVDIRAAGHQLGVSTVLEGSVQKAGDRLRITAQLSSAADGYHLWSETFDRDAKDVFAVQDEISHDIVRALEVQVSGDPTRRLATASTQDLAAYNLYLQGRFYLNKWTPDSARKGIEYFQQSIAKDPGYAPAYAGLADCYTWLATFGWMPAQQGMPKAREAAQHALKIDETLAAAHISLGYVKALHDWDWPGAGREFARALELSPGDPDAHFAYSLTYLAPLGRLDEALAESERARALDPLSPYKITAVGMVYVYRREYDHAIEEYKKAIAVDAGFSLAYEEMARLKSVSGTTGESNDTFARAYALSRQGKKAEARAMIENWAQGLARSQKCGYAFGVSEMFAGIGEKDLAFEWLDKAYAERNPLLAYAKVMPAFDNLRDDHRFTALLSRLGFAN